jgi:cytochrome c oxidase subunit 3
VIGAEAMSVIRYQPRGAREQATAWIGMVIFLGSWAMMFAALFFSYGMLRARLPVWPPPGTPPLPRLLPGINTLIIGLSSVAMQRGLSAARRAQAAAVLPAIAAGFLLGLAFLSLQFVLWTGLWRAGLRPEGGAYPSVFYGLTAIHAIHVAVGLGGLGWLLTRAFFHAFGPARNLGLRLWTGYWHFVGAVWLLMYLTVFLI